MTTIYRFIINKCIKRCYNVQPGADSRSIVWIRHIKSITLVWRRKQFWFYELYMVHWKEKSLDVLVCVWQFNSLRFWTHGTKSCIYVNSHLRLHVHPWHLEQYLSHILCIWECSFYKTSLCTYIAPGTKDPGKKMSSCTKLVKYFNYNVFLIL
jgi:hypothetical protein